MRNHLSGLLLTLMAAVLLALGVPLAVSRAAGHQQELVRDRGDDVAWFSSEAQRVIVSDSYLAEPGGAGGELDGLRAQLERYEQVYGIRAGVYDRRGQPIAGSGPDRGRPSGRQADAAFAEALAGRRSGDPPQVWPWQHRRIVVAAPVIHRGDVIAVVLTDSPTDRMRERIWHSWAVLAGGELVALIAAYVVAARLTGWVLRPVSVLDKVTHEIATGSLGARVADAQGPPELRRLARSFNEMADHVETVVDQQRAFAADASHQLRNPLAALMLRVEEVALLMPPDAGADVASALDGVRDEARRLTRVLDELLDLALAEHAAAEPRPVDAAALVRERLDAWAPMARRGGRSFDVAPRPGDAPPAHADPVALGSALDAVIDNALKFGPEDTPVSVTVRGAGDRVEISVADRGPGLGEDELRRAGDRFWRSPRHQNVEGSGLGLSIARTLLAACEGGLDIAPRPGGGLVVTLAVPAARPASCPPSPDVPSERLPPAP